MTSNPSRLMNRRAFLASGVCAVALAGCTTANTTTTTVQTPGAPKMLMAPAGEKFPVKPINLSKIPAKFHRQRVRNRTGEGPNTIVVDPDAKFLYFVESDQYAWRYGIGVGRAGFGWDGEAVIKAKRKWPAWHPPKEMQERDPEAAKWANGMPGGPTNPIGARGLYLYQGNVDTLYRIHGTVEAWSIGRAVSSGCIRVLNADVIDLYERVPLGTRVIVRKSRGDVIADAARDFGESVRRTIDQAVNG
ncbi:MAG: L,D-transpeptidase [Alphaproteobacteria bacterium]